MYAPFIELTGYETRFQRRLRRWINHCTFYMLRFEAMEKAGFLYTPSYCEENIFHLCASPLIHRAQRWALFISNESERVAMLCQASRPEGVVIWDYHVVMVARDATYEIWDLDTTLPFPFDAPSYLDASFSEEVPSQYLPRFRLVSAEEYLATFCSDRRHMRDGSGKFLAPPPVWPPIRPESGSNLESFISMTDDGPGRTLDIGSLRLFFGA